MKNPLWQPSRVKTLVFCPFDCPLQHLEETFAQIEYWAGSVQISTCHGLDLPGQASQNKQSEGLVANQEVPIWEKRVYMV